MQRLRLIYRCLEERGKSGKGKVSNGSGDECIIPQISIKKRTMFKEISISSCGNQNSRA